ncbi:MAG: dihydroorotase [Pseudomonadota bacterium]|nr:dihydroorotase [Pseudomonadota bacterium]
MHIKIAKGRVIDPVNNYDAVNDLYICDGKISAIGSPPAGFNPQRLIDASGYVVCPGLIDLSARLREPGYEYKATLESEMCAAVAGGVTSMACPPDTDPVLDEPGLVEMLKHRARTLNQAHVYPIGALTMGLKGQTLTEMAELTDAGCIAFSHADAAFTNNQVLYRAMQYAATFNFTVWLRPQDAHIGSDGVVHDGEIATRLGLPAIPPLSETIALSTIISLARETGVRLHICRLSTASGIKMVNMARHEGMQITCDVSAQHVHLCEQDIGYFNSHFHLAPPLRSITDRDAIRASLANGEIDAICSDHTPVDEDAKLLPFSQSEAGATGLELLLPLSLKWAREMNRNLVDALGLITCSPAKILGIDAGSLNIGKPADLCIFDPELLWRVTPSTLVSQSKNTPFLDMDMQGRVVYTLMEGSVVYETCKGGLP